MPQFKNVFMVPALSSMSVHVVASMYRYGQSVLVCEPLWRPRSLKDRNFFYLNVNLLVFLLWKIHSWSYFPFLFNIEKSIFFKLLFLKLNFNLNLMVAILDNLSLSFVKLSLSYFCYKLSLIINQTIFSYKFNIFIILCNIFQFFFFNEWWMQARQIPQSIFKTSNFFKTLYNAVSSMRLIRWNFNSVLIDEYFTHCSLVLWLTVFKQKIFKSFLL